MVKMLDFDTNGEAQYIPVGYITGDEVSALLRYNMSAEAKKLGKGKTVFCVVELGRESKTSLLYKFKQMLRRHDNEDS